MCKIGIVGLGNMGGAIATTLSKTFSLVGYDIDPNRREEVKSETIEIVESLKELADNVDYLILSMPRASISLAVIKEVIPYLKKDSIILETSTVLPDEVKAMRKICIENQVYISDVAILGGVSHMKGKTAELLVGDSDNLFTKILPILKGFSKEAYLMGEIGSGMAAKIINNGVAHAVMSVIVESAALGVKLGISPKSIYTLLSGETALQRPLTHRFRERILENNYEGGMSTYNATKDSSLFLSLAQQNNVPLFTLQSAHTVYEIANNLGYGHNDYAAIGKVWEDFLDISFSSKEEQ